MPHEHHLQPADELQPPLIIDGDLHGKTTPGAIGENIRGEWDAQREAVLALPTHEEGLDMDRVYAFREEMGMAEKPVAVLDPENYERAKQIAGETIDTEEGMYLSRLGIAIVKRDPAQEELNGPEYTESLVVHELAHADEDHSHFGVEVEVKKRLMGLGGTAINMSPYDMRGGFVVRNDATKQYEGHALEEGYAELIRGYYVADKLGRPNGFSGEMNESGSVRLARYTSRQPGDGEGVVTMPEGSYMACAIDMLSRSDPGLIDVIKNSRHSVEGLREVARRIDAIEPGLYRDLRKLDIGSDDEQTDVKAMLFRIAKIV